jgi:hypothetical protein
LLLDHDGCLPSYCVISEGKTHEIRAARSPELLPFEARAHLFTSHAVDALAGDVSLPPLQASPEK